MILNELADQGGLNNVLQRRLNMVGSSPAPSLMPEIGANLVLEVERPEWATYKRETLWSGYVSEAGAGAGTYTGMNITAAPNQLLVVERIDFNLASSLDWELGWSGVNPPPATLTSIFSTISRDSSGARQLGSLQSYTYTSLFTAWDGGFPLARVVSGVGGALVGPWVLRGTQNILTLQAKAANQTLRCTVSGYARPLLPNELV